jgi:outer membrane protein assembly factor BamB
MKDSKSAPSENTQSSKKIQPALLARVLLIFGALYLVVAIPAHNPDLLSLRALKFLSADQESTPNFAGLAPQFATLAHFHPSATSATTEDLRASFEYRGRAPHFGTDDRARVPLNLKAQWEFQDFNIGIHSASKASAAVDASGVYVGSDGGWFYAFEHDGRVRWRFHVGDARFGIHSTAALDQRFVYFGTYAGVIYAVEKSTGQLRWAIGDLGVTVGASIRIVDDDLVAAVETFDPLTQRGDGYLIRVRRSDGHVHWKGDWLGEQAHSTPAYAEASGLFIVGANNSRLIAIRATNGQVAWSIPAGGHIKSSPVIVGEEVLATTWGNELIGVEIGSGKVLRRLRLRGLSQSTPLVLPEQDRVIFLSNPGFIYGVSLRTFKLVWEKEIGAVRALGSATGTRTPNGDWVAWTLCRPERLCALRPQDGRVLSEVPLNGNLTGVPVAYENSLYVTLDAPGSLLKLAPMASNK